MEGPNPNVFEGETAAGAGSPAGKSTWKAEPASPGDPGSIAAPPAAFDKRDPYHLLKLFGVFSAASVLTILLLVGYGVYLLYSHEVIHDAQEAAVAVGHAIIEQERNVLLARGPDGRERVQVKGEDFTALDARMRNYLPAFNVYKIKVYSSDKAIVYSTDHSIVGKVDRGNAKLDGVLRFGNVNSKLESKEKVGDLAGEERFNVDVVETYLPIRSGDAIIGSFEVYVDVSRPKERIINVLASSVGILFAVLVVVFGGFYALMRKGALWLKEALDELRSLAATDMLTGIYNRRYLLARIQEEYVRMSRERRPQSVEEALGFIMIDIDHFKAINDGYGHAAGDAILREVSARLKRSLRAYDVLGRYGGEEFLAMLPRTDFEETRNTAERMRQVICGTPFHAGGASIGVTISAGVSHSANSGDDMSAAPTKPCIRPRTRGATGSRGCSAALRRCAREKSAPPARAVRHALPAFRCGAVPGRRDCRTRRPAGFPRRIGRFMATPRSRFPRRHQRHGNSVGSGLRYRLAAPAG